MLESIYVASNMASLFDSCKLITIYKISRPEVILKTGFKTMLLHHIEVCTQGTMLQGCYILY